MNNEKIFSNLPLIYGPNVLRKPDLLGANNIITQASLPIHTVSSPLYTLKTSSLMQKVKTQMKCSIMLQFSSGPGLFVKVKKIFRQKNTILFKYYLTSLDVEHGLSQVYCIKPEGRIH